MSLRPTLDFLLNDWLAVESLNQRERFADHSRETFDAVLDTCERIAREKYAPFNRLVDTQEPHFDGEKVILPQATHEAHKAQTLRSGRSSSSAPSAGRFLADGSSPLACSAASCGSAPADTCTTADNSLGRGGAAHASQGAYKAA